MRLTTLEDMITQQYKMPINELCRRLRVKKSELKCTVIDGRPILWQDGFFSFIELLKKYLSLIKPKRILEWGPGQSTKIMLYDCPGVEITCCEDKKKWFEKYYPEFGNKVDFIYVDAPERDRKDSSWDAYTNPAVKGKFDLIFVDGRERVKCLKTAFKRVNFDGVVLVHDSNRARYQPGIRLFNLIEESGYTSCLKIRR